MDINKITLDCRLRKCDDKIVKIFNTYETLYEGNEIVLITKTDPMRLYYELLSKTNGNFHWIPLKEGPNEWKVLIEKSFNI